MGYKIRKSNPDDVYGIREVQRITWLDTYPSEKYGITKRDIVEKFEMDKTAEGQKAMENRKKRHKDKNSYMWVVENEEKIVGFCGAIKQGSENRIGSLYVLPDYQGKGLGKSLIQKALNWLGENKVIKINVASYNGNAIHFYEKSGFIETGNAGVLDAAAKLPSGKSIPEIEMTKTF